MTTLNGVGHTGTVRLLLILALAFLSAACTSRSATDELPVATPVPSADATTERPSPAATEVEVDAGSLVAAWVRERNRLSESMGIEVEEETSVVALPGLRVYSATPLVPDMLDAHCAVYEEMVWCFREALQNIVRLFSLGADPGQLSDEEWLALVTFFGGRMPLAGPDDLKRLDRYIPADERAKISAPAVNRLEPGGVEIAFYYEEVDPAAYPGGPMALWKMEVAITDDNEVTVEDREVWLSPEDLWLTPESD